MAVVMSMRWAGVTPEQYEAARTVVHWEDRTPDGGIIHASWFEDDGLHVIDVWDSEAAFEHFSLKRLMPVVRRLGVVGEPQVTFSPLHRRFVAPGVSGAA
ncbi:hypothetical protein [Streptacidiphilus melanogenes]|uniref:hypothetical protein n=1 Tax=Streptacidiphilus melanogenes TaxID=411235 RepID=UPI0005A6AFAE|nr:hypothetical protein [Streptacidiphilus melanogenes]